MSACSCAIMCYNAFIPVTSTILETDDKGNNKHHSLIQPKLQSVAHL